MKKVVAIVALAVLTLTAMSGCSGNSGGSTTCGTYVNMSADDQTQAVKKMLTSRHGSASDADIALAKISVNAYCQKAGMEKSAIDGVYDS